MLLFKGFVEVKNSLLSATINLDIALLGYLYCLSFRERWDQFWTERMKLRHKLLYVSSLVSKFAKSVFILEKNKLLQMKWFKFYHLFLNLKCKSTLAESSGLALCTA